MDILGALKILAEGMGVPMAGLSLAWLLAQRGVTSVILCARKPAQLKDNLAAVDMVIRQEEMYALNAITGRLKTEMGTNADFWEGATSSRIR